MRIAPELPELTVAEAERCIMTPSDVWDLAVRSDLGMSEGPRFLNNVSDGGFIPFEKSGGARTSRRLYSVVSAVQLRAMWEITRSGRTYEFAAPIAQEVGRTARDMIARSTNLDAIKEVDSLIVYRASLAGHPDRIAEITQGQIAPQLTMGSYDIGLVRAGSIIVGVLRRYPEYWEKDRRAHGLSKLPARYHGVDDLGLPLDPDHKIYLKLPPLERAKRRVKIEEFIACREAKKLGGKE
jgi:hypothetical protein